MADNLPENMLRMDPDDLYREHIVSDRRAGTIRILTPVDRDGNADPARKVLYVGEAQIMTQAGALPIAFEIDADSLGEAAEKFARGAQAAMEDTLRELRQMQREASSGIVLAEDMPAGYGGKIQLR